MDVVSELARWGETTAYDAMTSPFTPINDDHAIEQVVFSLAFGRTFSKEDMSAFRERHGLWSQELPAIREPMAVALAVETEKNLRFEQAPGLEFAVLRPDGSAVWALRVLGPEIIIECSRYSRWARVWSTAQRFTKAALEIIANLSDPPPLVRASLGVQDAFVAPIGAHDPASLLQHGPLLPEAIFSRGPNWHAHSGWFADASGHTVLHNLNIDAVGALPGAPVEGAMARVAILHLLSVTRTDAQASETPDARLLWLDNLMSVLHQQNKSLIGELLIPELSQRIGLRGSNG